MKSTFLIIFFFAFISFLLNSCAEKNAEYNYCKIPHVHIISGKDIGFDKKRRCLIIFEDYSKFSIKKSTIKCRGGFSSKFFKHSYRIELDKKYSPFGLPKEDDWILNANYIDKTFMRHKLSYDIFRLMSPNNLAPECVYVNVYLNKKYQGLYVFMQRINAKFCGIDKKDRTTCLFKDPPVFFEEKISFPGSENNYYDQKYPEISEQDFTEALDKFNYFLFNASDSLFCADIGKWIDIDNVTDWHILLLLSNNADGLNKNFYIYKKDKNTPLRIAIWDYDHSFGRDGDNELNLLKCQVDCSKNILLKRLMELEECNYKIKLVKKWNELRDSKIISVCKIKFMILKNHFIINHDVERNFELWPLNSTDYYDDSNYLNEVALMFKYIEIRIPQLDNYFKKLSQTK
ncbi:MAG TPA: CotH kinase family protein [Bacteroidales bacterium]|nr:CotH kinase family protein [Bacteroidales bacterium]